MKLLRALTMRHHTYGRWALSVCVVLWLGVSFPAPSHAVPTTYDLVPFDSTPLITGFFTLDQDNVFTPFSAWEFQVLPLGVLVDTGFGAVTQFGSFLQDCGLIPCSFNLDKDAGAINSRFTLTVGPTVGPDLRYLAEFRVFDDDLQTNLTRLSQTGTLSTRQTVPEPASAILLAAGLLVLAGLRWLPRRGEQQQLG